MQKPKEVVYLNSDNSNEVIISKLIKMKTSILTAAENIKRNESLTINFESETTKGFVSIDTFCGDGETYVQIRKTNKFTNNIDLLEKFLKTKKGTINYLKKNI